jgi:hypothetical protein
VGGRDRKGISAVLARKRKERRSGGVARGERWPRVNTDRRRMASGPTGFLTRP